MHESMGEGHLLVYLHVIITCVCMLACFAQFVCVCVFLNKVVCALSLK